MAIAARFTPSLLDEQTLELLFVSRDHLVRDCVARVSRAATTTERSAKLLVGPRGAGKTHLISLVNHRARRLDGFGSRFQIAWLPEDLWTVDSFDGLITEIISALDPPPPVPAADGSALAALQRAVNERGPVVVLVENLDQVLDNIGEHAQRQLRALIENSRSLLLIATTTRLSDAIGSQAEPFYGFFDVTTLEPFSVDDAVRMLRQIAKLNGQTALADFLDSPLAHRRLAVIDHLAGGQPRIWALLAAGLTIDRLDELVETLVERFDDLTPYYQEQMHRLSGNERKVVRALSERDGAVTVKELAARTGIGQSSLAKTVTDLRRRGWVRRRSGPIVAKADRRLSYYELAEPLARLAFQLKETRGKPLRLVVEFLKLWFDRSSLQNPGDDTSLVGKYRSTAAKELTRDPWAQISRSLSDGANWPVDSTTSMFAPPHFPDASNLATALGALDDALAAFASGDPALLLAQPAAISYLIEHELGADVSIERQRLNLARLAIDVTSDDWLGRIEPYVEGLTGTDRHEAHRIMSVCHVRRGQTDAAKVLRERSLADATPADLIWLSTRYIQHGAPTLALVTTDNLLDRDPTSEELIEIGIIRAASLHRLGRTRDVIELWETITSRLATDHQNDRHQHLRARRWHAEALFNVEEKTTPTVLIPLMNDMIRELGPDHPDTMTARSDLALWTGRAGDPQHALRIFHELLADQLRVLGPSHPDTLVTRSNMAERTGDTDSQHALNLYTELLLDMQRELGPKHPTTLTARNNQAGWTGRVGDSQQALRLFTELLDDQVLLLGPSHPDTLLTRDNIAHSTGQAGDPQHALQMHTDLLDDVIRVLGHDHPSTLSTRHHVAFWTACTGDHQQALHLFTLLLDDKVRVLGLDNHSTVTTRDSIEYLLATRHRADTNPKIDEGPGPTDWTTLAGTTASTVGCDGTAGGRSQPPT